MLWLSFLLAAQATVAEPTDEVATLQLIDIEGLSNSEIGNLVLAGNAHRDIVDVREKGGFGPPQVVDLDLVESPVRIKNGCHRKLWTATFYVPIEGLQAAPALKGTRSIDEVSLARGRPCELASYAGLAANVSPARGLELLSELRDIIDRKKRVRFECSDATGSRLCRNDERIRFELRSLGVWRISEAAGQSELWLGTPGQIITIVKFGPATGDLVTINRKIPAPF